MLNKIWAVVFWITSSVVFAQENRYMVFFSDKNGSSYSINEPEEFLSTSAIQRRNQQGISITEQDLPVNSSYLQGIHDEGGVILYTTRWMNGALVQLDASEVSVISDLPYVIAVELVAPGAKPMAGGRKSGRSKFRDQESDITSMQLSMLGLDEMHAEGFHGEGVTVAILDAGFPGVNTASPFQHLFSEGRINTTASYNFVNLESNVFKLNDHGTKVLSTMAGYTDSYIGGAYKADYQLYITEDNNSEHHVEEYNWLFAAERADSAGVDVISTSLGYSTFDLPSQDYTISDLNGNTAVITRAANAAMERGILVITSAGNEGANSWKYITAPADAENILSVGSVDMNLNRASTSSVGPTADGRIKPDVMALGVGVAVLNTSGNQTTSSGTSFAAPLLASLVTGIRQQYPLLSNLEIVEAIKLSASQALTPDNFLGYGIPHYQAVVNWLGWEESAEIFKVYPNPIDDTLVLQPRNPLEVESVVADVISIQGQIIASIPVYFSWSEPTYSMDCTSLASGVYFLRVWYGNSVSFFKLVKN